MRIVATTGMPGSGKGEALKFFEKAGIPAFVMRTVIQAELEKRGIPLNNRTLREFATELRKKEGMDIVARMCVPAITELAKKHDVILVDGIRSYAEVKFFKEKFTQDFVLIAIHAPPKLRFERLKARRERWDMDAWEEFVWRDEKELGWGLGDAIALADFIVDNSGTLEQMHSQLKKVLKAIQK